MPRVARGYERTDFSALLSELNSPPAKEEKAQAAPEKRQEVSEYQRKRASLLSNPRMRYAFSDCAMILHDRDCELVRHISDKHFRMRSDWTADIKHCPECFRKAIIRSGIGDDGKRISAYENLLGRMKASNNSLRMLIIDHGAQLYGIEVDRVYLKVHDDRWMLRCDSDGLFLFHNNYEIIGDYQRLFKNGFHLQTVNCEANFPNFVKTMCYYSWKNHVKSFRFAEHEKKCQRLRLEFSATANFIKLKRLSLFHTYYKFMDLNRYGIRLCKSNGLEYSIISKTSHTDTRYKTVLCKVRRCHREQFAQLMARLKEYCVEQEAEDYADYCRKLDSRYSAGQGDN